MDKPIALWMLLRQTNLLMAKARRRELSKHAISEEASAVLFTISQLGRQATPSGISRRLFLERHSVSQLLTRMESDLLIYRVRDLERKNHIRVEFSAKGKEIFIKSRTQRITRKLLSKYTEVEQQKLWEYLVVLRNRAAKRLRVKNPLFYPPSDRQEVLNKYAIDIEKGSFSIHPAVALWMLLGRTARLVGKVRQKELNRYGISIDASAVLFTLSLLSNRATPANVSRYLFLEPNSVSQLVSRMENHGLLSKIRDLERSNYVRLEITPQGHDIFIRSGKHIATKSIMSVLSEDEQGEMESLLIKLRDYSTKYLDLRNPAPRFIYPVGGYQTMKY